LQKIRGGCESRLHHDLGALSIGTTIGLAAVVITAVPVLIIYLIFQRQLKGPVSAGTYK
jgi:ABC-type glycerol-3-phosphate transport system permease component